MPISPLAAAMMTGSGGDASLMAMDPALITAMPELQLAQGMEQQGTSTAPAYPGAAIARALQGVIGASLQKGALSDLAKAYAKVPGDAADVLQAEQPGNPAVGMLRSANPMVRMMGLQMLQKTVPIQAEGYTLQPGGVHGNDSVLTAASPMPQSQLAKMVWDAGRAQGQGNPAGAAAIESGITKETSTPEGVPFPPTQAVPRTAPSVTPAVAVPPPTTQQMDSAKQQLGDKLAQVQQAGITSPTVTGITGVVPPPQTPAQMPAAIAAAEGLQKSAENLYGGASSALGETIGDVIKEGGAPAREKMNALNSIQDALTFGGKGITTGPWSGAVVTAKQALDGMGFDTSWIKTGLPESEVVQKLNTQLATASARALSGRPSQFEYINLIKNNPGLMTSKQGTLALLDILRQGTQQDIDLGRLAQNKANWDKWGDTVDGYYEAHPLISPFTHQPMSSNAVNINAVPGAPIASAPSAANGGQPAPYPRSAIESEMRRRGLM